MQLLLLWLYYYKWRSQGGTILSGQIYNNTLV